MGATPWRLVLAAARPRWCVEHAPPAGGLALARYRPWSRKKGAPRQLDALWACPEALHAAGGFPISGFTPDLAENPKEPENALLLAAYSLSHYDYDT